MLTTVTITGVDDGVKHEDLHALSTEFPFVEWGILHSSKRSGTSRYPSSEWLGELKKSVSGSVRTLKLAAHFCGDYTRDVLAGRVDRLDAVVFQRCQVNGFKLPAPAFVEAVQHAPNIEFILQARSETDVAALAELARVVGTTRVSLLFDPSGGHGVRTEKWPSRPANVAMGYAGGIKPSTVVEVLREIGPINDAFWIDMESGVRVGDCFDLSLVREVLQKAAPFIEKNTVVDSSHSSIK